MKHNQPNQTAGQALKERQRQSRSDAMVRRHAKAGNTSVKTGSSGGELTAWDGSLTPPSAPRGDSLDHFLVDAGQLSRYNVSEKLAKVTAQRDELRADMRCIAESNGEDAVEFAKRSVAKFDPEMYPRLAAIAKAEQH